MKIKILSITNQVVVAVRDTKCSRKFKGLNINLGMTPLHLVASGLNLLVNYAQLKSRFIWTMIVRKLYLPNHSSLTLSQKRGKKEKNHSSLTKTSTIKDSFHEPKIRKNKDNVDKHPTLYQSPSHSLSILR